jgi:hypothetical protein
VVPTNGADRPPVTHAISVAPSRESETIVLGEAHLRRILGKYATYYNEWRIHRSLNKDSPFPRSIERIGNITSQPILGGLHHQYCRI